jgi:hypothetical protein
MARLVDPAAKHIGAKSASLTLERSVNVLFTVDSAEISELRAAGVAAVG